MRKTALMILVITALSLSACGATNSANKPVATSTTAASKSTQVSSKNTTSITTVAGGPASGFPPPCSLITKSQVSAILGVAINSVTSSSPTECSWVYNANKLVTGLGSNAVLQLNSPSPGQTPSQYYNILFQTDKALSFKHITIDGIKAAEGFASHEVLVDTGSTIITVAAITTVPGRNSLSASAQMSTIVVKNFCAKHSCS